MKIIDAFIFYNEEKMLNFRLNYYKDTVDYFVIVESTKTFSGVSKPLYFNNIKDKYSHFNNIIHYIVDDMPDNITIDFKSSNPIPQSIAWQREYHQRECIKKALKLIPDINDEDWILIADADEVANKDKLLTVKNSTEWYSSPDKIGYTLEFDNYYYNLTSKLDQKCYATKLLRYSEVKNNEIQRMRFSSNIYPLLIEFGWHFSYFFTPEMIKNKIQAFSHQEYNDEKYINKTHIEDCIKSGKSIFYLDSTRREIITHIPVESNPNLPSNYELLL
jgi:beta-1,4-mannosyl-glycoprotein beta-1,4-N-acetylglucosaminyltransferase